MTRNLTAEERDEITSYVYEAYRLGRYGTQAYLPMWHEPESREHLPATEISAVLDAVKDAMAAREGLSLREVTLLKDTVASGIGDYLEAENLSGHVVRQGDLDQIEHALGLLPVDNPFYPFFRHAIDELLRDGRVYVAPLGDFADATREAITDAVAEHDLVDPS